MSGAAKQIAFSLVFVLVAGLAQELFAENPPFVPIRFDVKLQSPSKVPFRGEVLLIRKDQQGNEEKSVPIEPGKEVRASLPLGSSWEGSISAPGFWVRR